MLFVRIVVLTKFRGRILCSRRPIEDSIFISMTKYSQSKLNIKPAGFFHATLRYLAYATFIATNAGTQRINCPILRGVSDQLNTLVANKLANCLLKVELWPSHFSVQDYF